jgi:hypothetical protein
MSSITDVLVVTGLGDDDGITRVNAWLAEHDLPHRQQLKEITLENAGGVKVSCVRLWAAAFNYLDIDGLAGAVSAAPWDVPASVVAYFDSDSTGETFTISPARPDRWSTRKPPGEPPRFERHQPRRTTRADRR